MRRKRKRGEREGGEQRDVYTLEKRCSSFHPPAVNSFRLGQGREVGLLDVTAVTEVTAGSDGAQGQAGGDCDEKFS